MTRWTCDVCGWDNRRRKCDLCWATPRANEATAAARLIYEAELRFSEQLGMPISLRIVGGKPPATRAEAQQMIAEFEEHARAQQVEAEQDCRGFHLVWQEA